MKFKLLGKHADMHILLLLKKTDERHCVKQKKATITAAFCCLVFVEPYLLLLSILV